MNPLSQNQAVLHCLLIHAGKPVAMPTLVDFTRNYCKTASYAIHSRISELRVKYGYGDHIENSTAKGQSVYKLSLPEHELRHLRNLYKPGQDIPHYSAVKAGATIKPKPVQSDMFAATTCRV